MPNDIVSLRLLDDCLKKLQPVGTLATSNAICVQNTTGDTLTVTILSAATIPFNETSYMSNTGFSFDGETITVNKTAKYYVAFRISGTAAVGMSYRATINGETNESLERVLLLATGDVSCNAILELNAGDKITLEAAGVLGTVALSDGVGAEIIIIELSDGNIRPDIGTINGAFNQGIDFDAPGKPSYQEWLDANVNNRYFPLFNSVQIYINKVHDVQYPRISNVNLGAGASIIVYYTPEYDDTESSLAFIEPIYEDIRGTLQIIVQSVSNKTILYLANCSLAAISLSTNTTVLNQLALQERTCANISGNGTISIISQNSASWCSLISGTLTIGNYALSQGTLEIYPSATPIFEKITAEYGQIIDNRPSHELDTFVRKETAAP